MDDLICIYCNKKFINKYTLKTHIENSIKCISKRKKKENLHLHNEKESDNKFSLNNNLNSSEKIKIESTECKYCNKQFHNVYNLDRHLNICIKNIYVDKKLYEESINQIKLLENNNSILNIKYNELNIKYNELNIKYNYLEEKYLSLQNKPNIINNFNSNIINNKNNLSIFNNLTPLTDSFIKDQASLLKTKDIVNGAKSLALFARDHSFKDRVICTDVSRRNFIFKDENNNIIKDPKGVKITKKFIENNKPELINLLTQYSLTFYNENNFMDIKHKLEIDHCLDAIKSGDISYNADKYNNFEKIFTTCFGKFVFNKEYTVSIQLDSLENKNLQLESKQDI
jgi:hypothetical protein